MTAPAFDDLCNLGVASRRRCLLSLASGAGLLSFQLPALAGGQLEEPLIDSVRTALSAAINNTAPPGPEFPDTVARINYLRWLGAMSQRLQRRKGKPIARAIIAKELATIVYAMLTKSESFNGKFRGHQLTQTKRCTWPRLASPPA